jgi:hypothetical protein
MLELSKLKGRAIADPASNVISKDKNLLADK